MCRYDNIAPIVHLGIIVHLSRELVQYTSYYKFKKKILENDFFDYCLEDVFDAHRK